MPIRKCIARPRKQLPAGSCPLISIHEGSRYYGTGVVLMPGKPPEKPYRQDLFDFVLRHLVASTVFCAKQLSGAWIYPHSTSNSFHIFTSHFTPEKNGVRYWSRRWISSGNICYIYFKHVCFPNNLRSEHTKQFIVQKNVDAWKAAVAQIIVFWLLILCKIRRFGITGCLHTN